MAQQTERFRAQELDPPVLAARQSQPRKISGHARGNAEIIKLVGEHFPDLITPARMSYRALGDPRAVELVGRHYPDLIVSRSEAGINTARLRAWRVETGLSPEDFARQVGVSLSHYRNVELGNKPPTTDLLLRIANRLGRQSAELLAGQTAA